jgi:predicted phosphoribosyltransferase
MSTWEIAHCRSPGEATDFSFVAAEIERRDKLYRSVRSRAPLSGRTVLLIDDGIASGAIILAALQAIKSQHPAEVIVAVFVASPRWRRLLLKRMGLRMNK